MVREGRIHSSHIAVSFILSEWGKAGRGLPLSSNQSWSPFLAKPLTAIYPDFWLVVADGIANPKNGAETFGSVGQSLF